MYTLVLSFFNIKFKIIDFFLIYIILLYNHIKTIMIQRLLIKNKSLTQTLKFTYLDEWGEHYIKPYNIKRPDVCKK